MGTAQSTRKITLVDDDKAGVIKLSESLAHRLRGQLEGQQAAAAARASPAAAQEPLHSTPLPPPQAPLPPPPQPSFIEKPLPIVPETPRIPEVAPLPEPPKVPDVIPVPEPPKVPEVVLIPVVPEPPEPSSSAEVPREVISEPLVPEPPPSLGESLPPDSVEVDPPLPFVVETTSDETSLSAQLPPVEIVPIEPADDDVSQISEPKESLETEASVPEIPASAAEFIALSDFAVPPTASVVEEASVVAEVEATAVVEEASVVAEVEATAVAEEASVVADVEATAVVEAASVVADAEATAVVGKIIEVHLPPPEILLATAFASDKIETAPLPSTSEVKLIPLPQVLPIPQVEETAPVPPPVVEALAAPDVGVAIKAGPGPTLAQPAGSIPPWSIYAEEAHLMVMRLREEKDQEIKKLNLEWRDKVDVREKEFVKMAKLSEEQVEAALKEVESLFVKASCNPVCQNQQEAVMGCYQDHPRQSLRCAREVEHFTQCVDLSRLQSIMKQEAH